MPVYEYACKACGTHVEVAQSFKDEPLTSCENCGGPLRKVFGSIGVVLKGSGFYRNDSRDDGKARAKAEKAEKADKAETADKGTADNGEKSDKADKPDKSPAASESKTSKSSESKTETKSESTPKAAGTAKSA